MKQQGNVAEIIQALAGICNLHMQRGMILGRQFTKVLANQWRNDTDRLHIGGSINSLRLHLAQFGNTHAHHQFYWAAAAIVKSKERRLISNIGGVKGTEDYRRCVYTNMDRRLNPTVFLTIKTPLLVARVGLQYTYDIASRESY